MRASLGPALIFGLAACMFAQTGKRLLLHPSEHSERVTREGREYYVGVVHLARSVEKEFLHSWGFQNLEQVGGTPYARKYAAIWPVDTDLDFLPAEIEGLDYDVAPYARSRILISHDRITTEINSYGRASHINPDGTTFRNFQHAIPARPERHFDGVPYAWGFVYLAAAADTAKLSALGFRDLTFQPQHSTFAPASEIGVTPYFTFHSYWPMTLDVTLLPGTVFNLISDTQARFRSQGYSVFVVDGF